MAIKGIDVSQWQGDINWQSVAADGVKFAIIREGYRKTIDPQFLKNIIGAKSAGVHIGVYHFIYIDGATLKENAESTVNSLKAAGLDVSTTWIFADLEYDTWKKAYESCTREMCSAYTKQYIDELKKLGAEKIGIYMNNDYYENYYTDELKQMYPIWLADYEGDADHPCMIQQYTSVGKVAGISNGVDMDWLYDESYLNGGMMMTKTEKATQQMEAWANDNSHGYDQVYRWGEKGDFDCSAAVISAWQYAGVPVKTSGATYTGNMLSVFKKCGFKDVTASVNLANGAGLKRGDVLLNEVHHTAMYIGNGQEVEASINEKGTATGGQPGDQTGREFLIRSYRNYPWTHVLRYNETGETVATVPNRIITTKYSFNIQHVMMGSTGGSVRLLQRLLKSKGYPGKDGKKLTIDGDAGENTIYAVKSFQKAKGLDCDGEVGRQTWTKLLDL